MTTVPGPPPDNAPARSDPGIGGRTARGFAWLTAQSIAERGLVAAGQILLAWLLVKQDFKLVTLTYTVITFAGLLQQFGLRQVLIQRYDEIERWATPAFWMALTLGLVAGGLTAAVAPAAAAFYGEPALTGLLLVASLALPIWSLCVVPEARVGAQMRFRLVAHIGVLSAILTFALSLTLALLGFGAYSMIIPAPVVGLVRLGVLWRRAGVRIHASPGFRLWRALAGDSTIMLVCSLAMLVTYQGHFVVLGRFTPGSDILGAFSLAYSLSDQATRTLMINLSGVLFPALSALQDDPARQARAFLRALRALMLVGIPLCLLQGVLAGPIFRVFFPQPWSVGTGAFVIFSVAMLGRLILGPCESMILAQRRQRTWLAISLLYAAGFLAATIGGTRLGEVLGGRIGAALGVPFGPAEGCAAGVALALSVVAPIAMRCCLAGVPGAWRAVWANYRFPLLGSLAAAAMGWLSIRWLPRSPAGDAAALVVGPLSMGAAYLLLVYVWARDDAYDLLGRLRGLLPARWAAALESRARRKGHVLGEAGGEPKASLSEPGE